QRTTSIREVRRDAIEEYLAALEKVYPVAKGKARVTKRPDNRVIVSVPLPTRASERMRLFDQWQKWEPNYCLRRTNILFCRANEITVQLALSLYRQLS